MHHAGFEAEGIELAPAPGAGEEPASVLDRLDANEERPLDSGLGEVHGCSAYQASVRSRPFL